MSKRTEPLIRHQSAFILQHKGDGARKTSTVCLSRGGGGRGWLMNVIERCIMEPSLVAGFRTTVAVDELHGVLR